MGPWGVPQAHTTGSVQLGDDSVPKPGPGARAPILCGRTPRVQDPPRRRRRAPEWLRPDLSLAGLPFCRFVGMRYAIARAGLEPRPVPGDTADVLALFDDARGCEKFAQRVVRFSARRSGAREEPARDEVLYVLGGRAELTLGEERVEVGEGTGLFVAPGMAWSVECRSPFECLSVLVP